jgi:XTP/dITP diphosphohydrolase
LTVKLLVATRNPGKLREIRSLLAPSGVEAVGLDEAAPGVEVIEDGKTFLENALKKARTLHAATGLPVLADDSGLAVRALGGRPGVRSARYAGEGADDAANNRKLLREMDGLPAGRRGASFVCAMVFLGLDGREESAQGDLPGRILEEGRGEGGFGYDPLFAPEGEERSLAEMTLEEKNRLSHRSRALAALLPRVVTALLK